MKIPERVKASKLLYVYKTIIINFFGNSTLSVTNNGFLEYYKKFLAHYISISQTKP